MNWITADNAGEVAAVTRRFLAPFDPPADDGTAPAGRRPSLDSRLVMDRLDAVVGVNNWSDAYTLLIAGEVECRLSVRIAGEWVTKAAVGSPGDDNAGNGRMKTAYADALARAAAKFGIGRYHDRPGTPDAAPPVERSPFARLFRAVTACETPAGLDAICAEVAGCKASGMLTPGELARLRKAAATAARRIAANS
ncbi:hypothetical protein [Fimbriiglobus ruber]|uniref:Putative DNA-binding protein Erf n=1 Tax=Fimbriiglobus ruber TaxID=1908690 RepID=A0A225DWR6_9BACT|nr:hypothetical protein [Fimbriiglobus ruber]OWK45832.1 putative DNA-binding protein Erf [Fimbriiglobus ruber]